MNNINKTDRKMNSSFVGRHAENSILFWLTLFQFSLNVDNEYSGHVLGYPILQMNFVLSY